MLGSSVDVVSVCSDKAKGGNGCTEYFQRAGTAQTRTRTKEGGRRKRNRINVDGRHSTPNNSCLCALDQGSNKLGHVLYSLWSTPRAAQDGGDRN